MKNFNRGQVMFWVVFAIAVVGLAALLAGGVSPASVKTKASFYPSLGSGGGFRPPLSEDQDFGQDILKQYEQQGYDVSSYGGFRSPIPGDESIGFDILEWFKQRGYDISAYGGGVGDGVDDIVIGEPEFPSYPPPSDVDGGNDPGGINCFAPCYPGVEYPLNDPCCGGQGGGTGGGQQPGGPGEPGEPGEPMIGATGTGGCDPEERPLTVTDDKGNQVTRCLAPANPKSKGQIDCENQGMVWVLEKGDPRGPAGTTCRFPEPGDKPAPTGCPSGWMLSRGACVLDPSGASGDRGACRDADGREIPGMWLVDDGKSTGTLPICVIS